jgi:hypothetical protein
MSPLTNALIRYWRRLPDEPLTARRRAIETLCERVRAGLETRAALVPFALGDVDDAVVGAATRAYVASAATAEEHEVFLTEAAEWVRRGLALNRGAVFGALLDLEDALACERLASLRLGLSAAEVENACRALRVLPGSPAARFLSEWLELIADGPLQRERRALLVALEGGESARAA